MAAVVLDHRIISAQFDFLLKYKNLIGVKNYWM